jgi:hypothetical protein
MLISQENDFFLTEINAMKELLDKYTDICENDELLDNKIIIEFKEFLDAEQNYLAEQIKKLSPAI